MVWGDSALALTGLAGWLLMALAYWPTLKLYGGNPGLALALPLIALFYTLMTLDSARRHWAGSGRGLEWASLQRYRVGGSPRQHLYTDNDRTVR
jgi:hypothetical protein